MKRPRFPAAPGKRNSRIMYPVATEQEQEEEEEGEEDLDISESSQYDESEHSPRQHDDPIGLITPEAIRDATRFSDLPLTEATASALRKCRYDVLTTIQRRSFPYSLSGYDVVGCARTGSGKTLSFLVPLLERLSGRAGDGIMWQRGMGLGALILTPTRELAVQIFETFRSVGRYHSHLSGGLATGGWSLEEEQRHIAGMSVLVATPGRMLQHLDQVADLELGNVSMLVMDEADRLLDDSFAHTIGNILEHLTSTARQRQTLLFSATLAPSIPFPPQLLLREQTVHYIAADTTSNAKASSVGGNTVTSVRLCQSFMVIPIDQKYSILYSFLVAHDRQKTIVFFATCHQAKFAFTVFSRLLRTHGVACAVLTGKMRQHQRAEVFQVCNQRTGALVLFCTDVASRGLDLPDIRWVVQFDCCDSPETYVHRVGRTARCGGKGSTLLMLLPSETDMLYYLDVAGVLGPRSALREVRLRSGRGNGFHVVDHLIAGEVARDAKPLAQRAYISYVRHVAQSEAKGVFRFDAIDREALARSMGLSSVPNEKVLNLQHRRIKNVAWEIYNATATTPSEGNDSDSVDSSEVEGTEKRRIPSRTEKKRKATHLQRELDRAGDLVKGSTFIWDTSRNTMEGGDEEDGDILELAGTVSGGHSKPLPRTVDSLSKKSQRLLKKRADVDIRVGTLGLSTRETFQDEED